jgi:DNA-directed RNA polymerase specialized sigma54-like protein
MQTELEKAILEKVSSLTLDQQEKVLEFVKGLEPPRRNLWEIWQEQLKDIPEEEWDDVPADASINLDHYLYGAPKK